MVWKMAWSSTDEFRLIHEDYQRARKGVSTLYADHFQALADSRRQLRVILSLPLLGMLAVVLGIPPQLEMDKSNLISLGGYVGSFTRLVFPRENVLSFPICRFPISRGLRWYPWFPWFPWFLWCSRQHVQIK